MIPIAYGGFIWWRHRSFAKVAWCNKCGPVSKWHQHWPLDEDDPQFVPPGKPVPMTWGCLE